MQGGAQQKTIGNPTMDFLGVVPQFLIAGIKSRNGKQVEQVVAANPHERNAGDHHQRDHPIQHLVRYMRLACVCKAFGGRQLNAAMVTPPNAVGQQNPKEESETDMQAAHRDARCAFGENVEKFTG